MKLKMAENSLFAILMRSPWWMSFGIAAGLVGLAAAALPPAWTFYGMFAAAPFVVTGTIAGMRQFRAPSAVRVEETLSAIRVMSSTDFAAAVASALRAEGFEVTRVDRGEADFEARKASRTTLVGCKRFKVARTGIKPLQDLHAAMNAREADDAIYVTAGELTDQAAQFAARNRIRVVRCADLVAWFPATRRARLRTA